MIWPDGHACIKGPWLGWRQSVGEPWFPMGPSKILGGCDVRSQEFVPVQSCQLAMSQSESAYSAIADWHWTTSNTTEVAIRAPYGDMGTSQRRNGDVRTWWHVGKIGPRSGQVTPPPKKTLQSRYGHSGWEKYLKLSRFGILPSTYNLLISDFLYRWPKVRSISWPPHRYT